MPGYNILSRVLKKKTTLQVKNTKILHKLQSLLAQISKLITKVLTLLHQFFICKTAILP